MQDDTLHVEFKNRNNPKAEFDLLRFENLLNRSDLNHDPCTLHLVEFYLMIFFEEGQGWHTIDFTDYPCSRGTILTIRKDQIHKFHKSNLKGSLLLFTNDFLESYLEVLEILKALQLFNEMIGSPKIQLEKNEITGFIHSIERIQCEYRNLSDEFSLRIIRSELHILITKLYRIKSEKGNITSQKKYLNEFIKLQNLVEHNVTKTTKVKDYALMMGLSTKTLNHVSKSILNKTAKELIDEISIKQIKRLLINTALSIKEIAFTSGFEETTNFYKYFKRHTKTTPEKFRISYYLPIFTVLTPFCIS